MGQPRGIGQRCRIQQQIRLSSHPSMLSFSQLCTQFPAVVFGQHVAAGGIQLVSSKNSGYGQHVEAEGVQLLHSNNSQHTPTNYSSTCHLYFLTCCHHD